MSFQTTPCSTSPLQSTLNHQATRLEFSLVAVLFALLALTVFGPRTEQAGAFHVFANQGTWLGIEHAADVLSNLPFGLGGLWGFWILNRISTQAVTLSPREQIRNICIAVFLGSSQETDFKAR